MYSANKNNDTENKRDESSSENVSSDMKIRIDSCFSCTEGPQETQTQNSDNKSEDENVLKELNFDKTEQYDSNISNIIKIRDSLFARKDNIVTL